MLLTATADVLNWIPQYGFPIVMCLILLKINKDNEKDNKEQTDKLSKVIENNTLTVSMLVEKINHIEEKINEKGV